jgi:hypothetical protein
MEEATVWDFLTVNGFFLIVCGLPILGWIVTDVAKNWRRVRVSEQQAALKQSMIERGMSADEIERVLNAGVSSRRDEPAQTT